MKLNVNTEQLDIISEALSSLEDCITEEYSNMKNVVQILHGQSVSMDSMYRAIQDIQNIKNEINLLVHKLRKIKSIYDDTENQVLTDIKQLPGALVSHNIAQQVAIYKSASSVFSQRSPYQYIKFVTAVPVSNDTIDVQQLFLLKNRKEFSKVMNRILALPEEQDEAWLNDKLMVWMRERMQRSTGYIPVELPVKTIDITDLFQNN